MIAISGLLLACISGVILGSFLAPMNRLRHWPWENFWVVWSVFGLFLGPSLTAALSIPHVLDTYSRMSPRAMVFTILVGAIAGTSGFLYSRSVPAIGFGLATALDSGSGLAVGSLIPLFAQRALPNNMPSTIISFVAIALATAGIWVCTKAGSIRASQLARANGQGLAEPATGRISFWKGVAFSIFGGAIASCMNLGLVFQGDIAGAARAAGASEFGVSSAFLAPYFFGAFLSNIGYAAFIAKRNQTLFLFRASGISSDWRWSIVMGLLFAAAMAAYSGGIAALGTFGTVVGWGLKTAVAIAVSSIWDLRRGEWSDRAKRVMLAGVGILIISVLLLMAAQEVYVSTPIG